MYQQKTIICGSIEELDKKANKLYKDGSLCLGPPIEIKNSNYMQTFVTFLDEPERRVNKKDF